MAARPLESQPAHPVYDMRSDKECVSELLSHLQLLKSKYLNTDSSTRMQVSIQSCKMHICIVDKSQWEAPWTEGLQHKDGSFPSVMGKFQQAAEPHSCLLTCPQWDEGENWRRRREKMCGLIKSFQQIKQKLCTQGKQNKELISHFPWLGEC